MKRGILAPPTGPLTLSPRSTNRAEHVPTHDGGPNTRFPFREEFVVEPVTTAFLANHLTAAPCGEDPFVESCTADPKWMVEILSESGAITIERHREAAYDQS